MQMRSDKIEYRLLFDRSPQPMLVYERATLRLVAVNDAAVASYGFSREEFLTLTVRDIAPREDLALVDHFLATAVGGERPGRLFAHQWRHRYKDGTVIDVEITSDDLEVGGRSCRILFCQNVTERRQSVAALAVAHDAAVEACNLKSAFLANMSHEIRTPMNAVIGMTELLRGTELTDEQRGYADHVARAGEQMLAIIGDILDISKIETGHLELEILNFDLHEQIKATCSAPGGLARMKGLELVLSIDERVPRLVRGDFQRLQQVLLNLVSNAVKFTSEGSVAVRVTASERPPAATMVRFEVADTGIGIDPTTTLEQMFEPFTQADVSTTRPYGGTGLGLAIARELVCLMGGTINATSEPRRGSTFHFEIPLEIPTTIGAPNEVAQSSADVAAASGMPSWSRPPLVLIVEDSQINQIVAARALERCGCRTHFVNDAEEAIKAFRAQRYDAILMDCQMPNLDGYRATAELRQTEHGERHTPIIAMTAHAMQGDRERCLAAGMDDCLAKPMRHNDLQTLLRRWIGPETKDTAPENRRSA